MLFLFLLLTSTARVAFALLVDRQTNLAAPTNENFIRRGFQASIVLGDYLYINGGELAQHVDGALSIYPENNTLSIDLRYSWTNSTVSFNVITQSAPVLNSLVLWADDNGTSFYQWAGEQSSIVNSSILSVPQNDLYQFTPDGQGSGTWQDISVPSNFIRTSSALYASGGGTGYLFGGYLDRRTSPDNADLGGWPSSQGLVSYNMTIGSWLNETSCVDGSCFRNNGYMDFIPAFGSAGVLVALGGCSQDTPTYFGLCNATSPNNFSTIEIYDPSQSLWFTQTASNAPGELPEPRQEFCGVGVQGDNGTYEIFIFGGGLYTTDSDDDQTYLDEVFVFSLPGFVWSKADYPPSQARAKHSCNVIGQRQMFSIGGINPTGNTWLPADPWTQSIGIFDMTEMQWTNGHNASAQNYVTPAVVKSWYQQNGMYPTWDSDGVQQLFVNKLSTMPSNTTTSPSSNSTSAPPTSTNTTAPASFNHTGAIAGGVVGGVAGLALVAGLAFFILRRRQKKKAATEKAVHPQGPTGTELPTEALSNLNNQSQFAPKEEYYGKQDPPLDVVHEVDAGFQGAEVPAAFRQASEMQG